MLRLESVERLNLALIAAAVVVAALTHWFDPWSVALGGGMMAVNVWLMKGVVRRALRPGDGARMALALAMLIGKFGLLLGLLGLLFWKVPVDGLGFAAGVTMFLVAAVVEAVRAGASGKGES